jgi:HEAT repeat protein
MTPMRRAKLLLVLALVSAPAARASADGAEAESPQNPIFFRDPDKETATRIGELISRMATGSVQDRQKARGELASIGYWSVDPLIESATKFEPPIRCASILVLDAIGDRRAVDTLHALAAKETSHPYIAAFSTLSLGRFRDASAIDVFRTAVKTSKSLDLLKAAVPFAAAKIRTPEARDFVVERARATGQKERVRSAALLSLGFFPESAMGPNGIAPGPDIAAGLASKRRGERQAALLGYLVAACARGDVKQTLKDLLATESTPEVAMVGLIGLSRSADADVTELLARTAARQGDDRVRELAADLLLDRVDAATKPLVIQVAHSAASARLRAACVLALGRLDDEDARRLVVEKLADRAPIVRAAAAVALTRRNTPAAREAGLALLDVRMRHAETNDDVKADLEKARAVLAGERTDVRWTEIGPEALFSEMQLTYTQRLLRAVNYRFMACIDLAKITNLQTDSEIVTSGPPSLPGSEPSDGESDSGDTPPPSQPGEPPPAPTDGPPSPGVARTSQYQELRDLRVELELNPYFGPADLPSPPTTPGAGK